MHTDNDLGNTGLEGAMDSEDENQEKSLDWLLDMDLDEPEETLFAVTGDEYRDEGLSAYEAEVAGRPLTRGNAASDDLASYVAEEIVISSDNACSDIYASSSPAAAEGAEDAVDQEIMAIDYSLGREAREQGEASSVDEGSDILGLASDDDMGEKFLAIKRVRSTSVERAVTVTAADVADAEIEQSGTVTAGTPDSDANDDPQEPVALHGDAGNAPDEAGFDMSLDLDYEELQAIDLEICGEQEGSEASVDVDDSPSIQLTEAPVPTQVADPGLDLVANEGPVSEDGDINDGLDRDLAADFVASIPASADDEDFEDFLRDGEHLLQADADPEELTIQPVDGLDSVDPSTDTAIDYHEDFHSMEGFSDGSVTEIAAVIAPVMEEISAKAMQRAAELGLNAPAVDVMLGSDEQSIKRCYAEGYEPVFAICHELPRALLSLGSAERDMLYVRLLGGPNNDNWNDLFSPDFTALDGAAAAAQSPLGESLDIDIEMTEAASIGEIAGDAVEAAQGDGFGEDIFGEDFAADFDAEFAADDTAITSDIEAVFSDLSATENTGEETQASGLDSVPVAQEAFLVTDEDAGRDESSVEEALFTGEEAASPEESLAGEEPGPVAMAEESVDSDLQLPPADGSGMAWCIPEGITFSYASQGNTEIFADFLDAFIEEGAAEVEKLENIVGEWEKDVAAEAHYAEACRTLHTIKGIAKGVGLQRYGTLVHNFETLLDALPRPEAGDEQMYFRIVNAWLDAVVRGIDYVTEQRVDIVSELPAHPGEVAEEREISTVEAVEEGPAEAEAEAAAVQAAAERKSTVLSALEKKRDKQLADEGAKVLAAQQSVRITSEKLDHLLNLASQAQQLGVRASQNTSRSKRSSAELQGRLSSVRSHIGKIADRALLNVNAKGGSASTDLDALEMDQYSELQEAASILREGVEDLADLVDVVSRQNSHIEALLKQQSSVISSISSSIQGARVVPVSRLMPGLRRIVRTVSTDLDKVVSFKVLNETGALDRDHYARLQVVMEHMVRNALDHGIESPDERLAAGKPTGGRITIDVRKSGGDYIIKLSDDGRGIDTDAIRESAYEKGLDVDVYALSDEEVMRLIFHKGFTTADTLSEISGRGVGMDIVLTELQQIGGDIQIQSAVGLGTTFEVRIPSNVSVNGALLVAAGNESYAIPLNGLVAVEQVPVEEFFAAVESGTPLSLFDTECEPAYLATLCQGVGLPDRSAWNNFVPVIIAGSDDRHMAIAIDNVEEALELVVRSLGSQFSTVPGVAGAATTADGEAIVALDLNLLVGSVGADGIAPLAVDESEDRTLLALVVDDSRTQRMVATSQLDTVGVETVTAENGLVAIDLLNAAHRLPDVILLDVEMPVKDGIETLREVRKSQRYGHLPVIMVTSRTGAKHRALAKEAGCSAYMGKPFNFPALIEQINDLTGHDLQLS